MNSKLNDRTPKVIGKDKDELINSAISATAYISSIKISSNTERSNYTNIPPITLVHSEAKEPSRTEGALPVSNNILAKSSLFASGYELRH